MPAGLGALRLGLTASGKLAEPMAEALALLAASIVQAGGLVVLPQNATLLRQATFCQHLFGQQFSAQGGAPAPSLSYGEYAKTQGLHIMEAPTRHHVETVTGLGGTGVELMAVHLNHAPVQTHPMIPLVQFSHNPQVQERFAGDLDCVLPEASPARDLAKQVLRTLLETASGTLNPKLFAQGNADFQLTRGELGFSL